MVCMAGGGAMEPAGAAAMPLSTLGSSSGATSVFACSSALIWLIKHNWELQTRSELAPVCSNAEPNRRNAVLAGALQPK